MLHKNGGKWQRWATPFEIHTPPEERLQEEYVH